ncbi:MAG: LuxR C-terminal-related transcriptional regulator [Planctomycetota bacterium]
MTKTHGVGISVMDRRGGLIYVNETSLGLFFDGPVEYEGKTIADLHPPEFVVERLEMIRRVLDEDRPLVIEHIFRGKPISSAVWPIRDVAPPYQRVLVISRRHPRFEETADGEIEVIDTSFIELGELNVLTPKELEVLAMIGHGLSVPKVARLLRRSQKTIENHKAAITQKLHLNGQAEMVAIVTSLGLDLDDAKRKRMSLPPDGRG